MVDSVVRRPWTDGPTVPRGLSLFDWGEKEIVGDSLTHPVSKYGSRNTPVDHKRSGVRVQLNDLPSKLIINYSWMIHCP